MERSAYTISFSPQNHAATKLPSTGSSTQKNIAWTILSPSLSNNAPYIVNRSHPTVQPFAYISPSRWTTLTTPLHLHNGPNNRQNDSGRHTGTSRPRVKTHCPWKAVCAVGASTLSRRNFGNGGTRLFVSCALWSLAILLGFLRHGWCTGSLVLPSTSSENWR